MIDMNRSGTSSTPIKISFSALVCRSESTDFWYLQFTAGPTMGRTDPATRADESWLRSYSPHLLMATQKTQKYVKACQPSNTTESNVPWPHETLMWSLVPTSACRSLSTWKASPTRNAGMARKLRTHQQRPKRPKSQLQIPGPLRPSWKDQMQQEPVAYIVIVSPKETREARKNPVATSGWSGPLCLEYAS